ncbi:hypothetical protein GCM10028790_55780 [Micromonospora taraxaci]|uniref:Uncharacterized protein n=1 Tax=Micromonospora taraxaci TaxID=1316803 RepID=A0A561W0Z0_9ACTN|nr:hypothetical protein [Micromonospora taraxaci]TWG17550.1 hypothetical protein FHU34_112892 [Micromonospora taraxaci]
MDGGQLKAAGMFREFGPVRSAEPQESIFDSVAAEELPDVAQVVAYLNSGHVLIDVMDVADDAFDSTRQVMNGSTVMTDGDWLWRKDLAYYVRRHRVAVPAAFLALIRERDYVVPFRSVPELTACSRQARDLMFWNG